MSYSKNKTIRYFPNTLYLAPPPPPHLCLQVCDGSIYRLILRDLIKVVLVKFHLTMDLTTRWIYQPTTTYLAFPSQFLKYLLQRSCDYFDHPEDTFCSVTTSITTPNIHIIRSPTNEWINFSNIPCLRYLWLSWHCENRFVFVGNLKCSTKAAMCAFVWKFVLLSQCKNS